MKNISFDNPYLLLVLIPLLALVITPYCIAIRKENRKPAIVISFILHIVISLSVVLAFAGTKLTTVMTRTDVYVVCDVSYSSNRNLDKIDGLVEELEKKLPDNSRLGVVLFGKDQQLLCAPGEDRGSVKDFTVDDSATDIVGALNYTASLFEDDCIKRIVLITDGKDTIAKSNTGLVSAVEGLYSKNVYVDAIYVDSNIGESVSEVQISSAEFTPSTYLNHETDAGILIRSNTNTKAIVTLYKNGEKLLGRAVELVNGFNVVNFELPTDTVGTFEYRAEISCEKDTTQQNNTYTFEQRVTGEIKLLLITNNADDVDRVSALYGESAQIDAYVNESIVPCSVEQI